MSFYRVIRRNAPPAWTPTKLSSNLRLWLKADAGVYDAETGGSLITADGTAVRRWEDQSGVLTSHPTSIATNAPTYETDVLNGLPVIRFTTRGLVRASTPIYASNPSSLQIVALARSRGTSDGFQSVIEIAEYHPALFIMRSTDSYRPFAQFVNVLGVTTDTTRYDSAWNSSSETWQLLSIRADFPNDALALRRDGGSKSYTATPNWNANSLGTANRSLLIGSRYSATIEPLNGDIAEIVVVTNDATDDTRNRIEGYLAHKWGLAANLATGHPYKNAAPTA